MVTVVRRLDMTDKVVLHQLTKAKGALRPICKVARMTMVALGFSLVPTLTVLEFHQRTAI
jgi:hypothetical protein